ncbi:hypothetical protein TWF281_000473 [Arthrobotrys megalospora]
MPVWLHICDERSQVGHKRAILILHKLKGPQIVLPDEAQSLYSKALLLDDVQLNVDPDDGTGRQHATLTTRTEAIEAIGFCRVNNTIQLVAALDAPILRDDGLSYPSLTIQLGPYSGTGRGEDAPNLLRKISENAESMPREVTLKKLQHNWISKIEHPSYLYKGDLSFTGLSMDKVPVEVTLGYIIDPASPRKFLNMEVIFEQQQIIRDDTPSAHREGHHGRLVLHLLHPIQQKAEGSEIGWESLQVGWTKCMIVLNAMDKEGNQSQRNPWPEFPEEFFVLHSQGHDSRALRELIFKLPVVAPCAPMAPGSLHVDSTEGTRELEENFFARRSDISVPCSDSCFYCSHTPFTNRPEFGSKLDNGQDKSKGPGVDCPQALPDEPESEQQDRESIGNRNLGATETVEEQGGPFKAQEAATILQEEPDSLTCPIPNEGKVRDTDGEQTNSDTLPSTEDSQWDEDRSSVCPTVGSDTEIDTDNDEPIFFGAAGWNRKKARAAAKAAS